MNATVKFTDHTSEFISRVAVFADQFVALIATNIEIQIKTSGKTPFKHGALRASARANKVAAAKYEVTAGTGSTAEAYAAAQEAGTTRGHVMHNYTTPGTGAGWFQDAIDTSKTRASEYAQTASRSAGIESVE